MSTPTARPPMSRYAYMAAPTEPSVSARTQDAPPCSSPYGWVFPSTGIDPTTRSGAASSIVIPIRAFSAPSPDQSGSAASGATRDPDRSPNKSGSAASGATRDPDRSPNKSGSAASGATRDPDRSPSTISASMVQHPTFLPAVEAVPDLATQPPGLDQRHEQ